MFKKMDLEYGYDELEPYIDKNTVYIHYNNHYLMYLYNLNELIKGEFNGYSKEDIASRIDMVPIDKRGEVLYNLGGVINHEIYFDSMTPHGIAPRGAIFDEIIRLYGSFDNFKSEFIKKADELVGSGFTFLVMDRNGNLFIINTSNNDTPYYYGLYPLLALDLWEHSYYLKYRYHRDEYIRAWFNLINWNRVNELYLQRKRK